jgi:hypothetical protein
VTAAQFSPDGKVLVTTGQRSRREVVGRGERQRTGGE